MLDTGPIVWAPARPPKPVAADEKAAPFELGLIAVLIDEIVRETNAPPFNERLASTKSPAEFLSVFSSSAMPFFNEGIADGDGNLYFGAYLGQIRVRDAKGLWSSIGTGTLAPIATVGVSDGQLFALSWSGEIYSGSRGGEGWHVVARMPDGVKPLDAVKTPSGWIVAGGRIESGTSRWSEALLYEVAGNEFAKMELIHSITVPQKPTRLMLRGRLVGDTYYLNTFYKLYRHPVGTNTWDDISPKHLIDSFWANPDNGYLTAFHPEGLFSKMSVSADGGATWTGAAKPSYPVQDVAYRDANQGAGVRLSMGAFSSRMQFVRYDHASQEWKLMSEVPDGVICTRTLSSADKQMFFCATEGRSIFRFGDDKAAPEFLAE